MTSRDGIAEFRQALQGERRTEQYGRSIKAEDGIAVKSEAHQENGVKMEMSSEVKDEVMCDAVGLADARPISGLDDWLGGGICEGVQVKKEPAPPANHVSSSQGPAPLQREQDGSLWFYFIDAFEEERASPPRIHLFGKVRAGKDYASCCVVVEKVERCVHLMLNVGEDQLDDDDHAQEVARQAEAEFDSICQAQCPGVKKLRAKFKKRNYAFEKPLPQGCVPFLKVICDSAGDPVPAGLTGTHFSHVFGAQTSLLERLLLTRQIKGPSWLLLQAGTFHTSDARLSFCAHELRAEPNSIFAPKKDGDLQRLSEMGLPSATPPLKMLCISMQTVQRGSQSSHEPVVVSLSMHRNVNTDGMDAGEDVATESIWTGVRQLETRSLPHKAEEELGKAGFQHFQSEYTLLEALLAKVSEFDPDVIAGHRAYTFDLDLLASRLNASKVPGWQRLGRLRRAKDRRVPTSRGGGAGFWLGSNLAAGRLVCDLALQAKDLLPRLGTYDLPHIAAEQLGDKRLRTVEPEALPKFYDAAPTLVGLGNLTNLAAFSIARLVHSLQILPLSKQLTSLAGNSWNLSLQNQRAQRNEMLLCHEFHRAKFVLPDRETAMAKKRRLQGEAASFLSAGFDDPDMEQAEHPQAASGPKKSKAAYSGGLVLEPKVGLYDDFVLLLDFNSLYPSIIQEYNLCFTTVERPDEVAVLSCADEAGMLNQTILPDSGASEGILPQVIRRLVDSRRTVKQMLKSEKDERRKQNLEIRQKALKLTANSMYGCLGFQNSRFYAKPIAALITAKGREALQNTCTIVQQQLSLEVVYGDTDSVFVNSRTKNYDEAMRAADVIKRAVNKNYKKLEIEIDGVFGRLLLLKKKKYAAVKVVVDKEGKLGREAEYKGLDIVRRDWCGLAKEMGLRILEHVLSDEGKEEVVQWVHSYLTEQGRAMSAHQVALEKYVILKGLTKAPGDYPDAKHLPHVQVALRLIQRGRAVCNTEDIEYVISDIPSETGKSSFAERARHPQEFKIPGNESLKPDVEWYKSQQVHALISRLLVPLEGTDAGRIAECLGMDGTRFAKQAAAAGMAVGDMLSSLHYGAQDVATLLVDRTARWKDFESLLPGLPCPATGELVPWKMLLRPQETGVSGIDGLFRTPAGKEIHPMQACNKLAVQLRALLQEHCEGWVQGDDAMRSRTRRASIGDNVVTERRLLEELEYMEELCKEACGGYSGKDTRGCRQAAEYMRKRCHWMLECNGRNWVDCGQIFSSFCKKPSQIEPPTKVARIGGS
mmetsp:Transcript_65218/g.155759  ORF Transcript_65218/g.155759 Transcript_65218/m.155759 type:complete len:1267 (+) Transcript_65218:54-3854(+)